MRKLLLLLPFLLTGCGFMDYLVDNPEVVEIVGDVASPATGGIPIIKWLLLAVVGGYGFYKRKGKK